MSGLLGATTGRDSPECERLKAGVGRRTILLNTSAHDFLLLTTPTDDELTDLVLTFRAEHKAWLWRLMTSRTSQIDGNKNKVDIVYGATVYAYRSGQKGSCFRFLNYGSLPADAISVLRRSEPRLGLHEISRVLNLTNADAKEFISLALGNALDNLKTVFNPRSLEYFVFPELEVKAKSIGVAAFLAWCASSCTDNWKKGRTPNPDKSPVPFLFMLFLHRKGYVLFPAESVREVWAGLAIPDTLWLCGRRKRLYLDTLKTLERVSEGYGRHQKTSRMATVLRQILLRSTIVDERDVSTDLGDQLYDYEAISRETGKSIRISTLSNKVMRAWSTKVGLQLDVTRNAALVGRALFRWTYDPVRSTLPPGVPRSYRPNQLIISWAHQFQIAIGRIHHTWVNEHRAAANLWLAYLLRLKRPPGSIAEVLRHVHINSPGGRDRTVLALLDAMPVLNETKNQRLSILRQLFHILIDGLAEKIENPIDLDLDRYKIVSKRSKTPRTPLSREMLGYIKEFNRRDGASFLDAAQRLPEEARYELAYERFSEFERYGFSRSLDQHYFEHRDELSGQLQKVWWPGVAVLLELLLEVPVRGFQARFLDSGEADEFVLDPRNLKMTLNDSPIATSGRQQGALYIAEDMNEKPILGLFINTNKTGFETRKGYRIPWCPDNLAESLHWLRSWNLKYKNTGECPLTEKLNYQHIQNPVVKNLLGTTHMLFRDPITDDGWPLQKSRLSAYWVHLLTAVEKELKAQGFLYSLTREVVRANGTVAREALFDIHTLRVSGITAMIEAGMPAELVQEVVGHASVVMTLYYTRLRAGLLNDRLRRFREGGLDALDPADIPELQGQDTEDLLLQLMNRRPSEDAVGAAMLRANPSGLGNGSFHIFADGLCPGGECASGGEINGSGYSAVPRHRACSLCRYRLTGPMFLAGLVHNANSLMYELRKIGLSIRVRPGTHDARAMRRIRTMAAAA